VQFLKFHGIYQQDDRDLRKAQKKFIMMIRGRIPGGVMTRNSGAYLTTSPLNTATTRFASQRARASSFTALSSPARPAREENQRGAAFDTGGCGDVNRNVMAPPTPAYTQARAQVFETANAWLTR